MSKIIIGTMAGSSLDGLDMALCRFTPMENKIHWEILSAMTVPLSVMWKEKLRHAPVVDGFHLMQLDAEFGIWMGQQVKEWITPMRMEIDCIASHGYTVFHEPGLYFSTQIGCGAQLSNITGLDAITSFRSADVARGGQGAPYAPVADRDLMGGYDAFLNLGGIANVSVRRVDGTFKAWDVCPCNQVLNALAEMEGQAYDHEGLLASSGKSNDALVTTLINAFPYRNGAPFSLSNQQVRESWHASLAELAMSVPDKLASATIAIAKSIHHHIVNSCQHPAEILVTGGGAHNSFLLHTLRTLGRPDKIHYIKPDNLITDYKESLLIAYLGYLFTESLPMGAYTFTGANADYIGGTLHKAL